MLHLVQSGKRGGLERIILLGHPLVLAQFVEGKRFNALNAGILGEKVGKLLKLVGVKSKTGDNNMADPDRFADTLTIVEKLYFIFQNGAVSGDVKAGFGVKALDVKQEHIGFFDSCAACGKRDSTGSVDSDMNSVSLELLDELKCKLVLQHRFTTGEGDSSTVTIEGEIVQNLGNYFIG